MLVEDRIDVGRRGLHDAVGGELTEAEIHHVRPELFQLFVGEIVVVASQEAGTPPRSVHDILPHGRRLVRQY